MVQLRQRRAVRLRYISCEGDPIAAFAAVRDMLRPAMLLESAPGAGTLARHSLIALGTTAELIGLGSAITLTCGSTRQTYRPERVLEACRALIETCRPLDVDPTISAFLGAYGVVSFEFAEYFERINSPARTDACLPDIHLVIPEVVVVFDHVKQTTSLLSLREENDPIDEDLRETISRAVSRALREQTAAFLQHQPSTLPFCEMVERAKASIYAGDVYQIVLSQGWFTTACGDALDVYRRLRTINPSPYMFFLELPEATLLGASPEMVCTLNGRLGRVRPLAGTCARPIHAGDEQRAAFALRTDPKERAEHVMLVDLARNDLGRVCEYGSVRTNEMLGLERFSHVMHLVSDVQGILAPGRDAFDLFTATFPAGTVSGAPKIRAMQLIGELEARRRGWYAGAVLKAGFDGSLESCIVLRSATVRSGRVELRAGAGIVADSIAEREDAECRAKARALAVALGAAELAKP